MAGRLLVCDLDGTLIDEKGAVVPGVASALDRLAAEGVACMVCTGRPLADARRLLAAAGLYAAILAVCHGALVIDRRKGRYLRHVTVPGRLLPGLLDAAREGGLSTTVYLGARVFSAHDPLPPRATRLIMLGEEARVAAALPALRELAGGAVLVDRPAADRIDVRHARATKDQALCLVAERLGVALADTVAVGDDVSDVAMLRSAGRAVVVGGRDSPIRDAGDVLVARAELAAFLLSLAV